MRKPSFSHLTSLSQAPPDLIDFVADASYESTGIRLCPAVDGGVAYPLNAQSQTFKRTMERLKARHIAVLDIEVMLLQSHTQVRDFESALAIGAQMGAKRICVNGEDEDLNRFTQTWGQMCELAAQFDMQVDLEFMVWRPIKTLQIAVDIVQKAGCSNGKVLVDALHLFRSGGSVAEVRAVDPRFLGALQLCDGPLKGPHPQDTQAILAEARSGRSPPSEGEFPLIELIQAMPLTSPISVEVPMTITPRFENEIERVKHVLEAATRCIEQSGLD